MDRDGQHGYRAILHTATLLPNGQVLVAGIGRRDVACASAELYDPATGLWTRDGQHGYVRYRSYRDAPAQRPGARRWGTASAPASAELYDPATGLWTATGSMNKRASPIIPRRSCPTARCSSLEDFAAIDLSRARNSMIRRPGCGRATGSMADARGWHTATLLPNGQVLVAGGYKRQRLSRERGTL